MVRIFVRRDMVEYFDKLGLQIQFNARIFVCHNFQAHKMTQYMVFYRNSAFYKSMLTNWLVQDLGVLWSMSLCVMLQSICKYISSVLFAKFNADSASSMLTVYLICIFLVSYIVCDLWPFCWVKPSTILYWRL